MLDKTVHEDNYNHFLSNIEHFTEQDDALKITTKHFGISAMNSFIRHNSSPRGIMSSSMAAQSISIHKPKPNMIQSGLDTELGKYVVGRKLENNSEVIAVIKRYNAMYPEELIPEYVLVYKDLETGIIDCLEIPRYSKLHTYFGVKHNIDDRIDIMSRGEVISADTFISKPPALEDDGSYSLGRDVNVALMPLDQNDEDGFIISDKMANDFSFSIFETRSIEINEDEFLIDLNSDPEGDYKGMYSIGDTIREDGVVFGVRKYNPDTAGITLSKKALKEFNPTFDNIVYGRPGYVGKVIDLKVYKSDKRRRTLPTGTSDILDVHADGLVNYYKQIINIYDSLNAEHKRFNGSELVVGNIFNTLLVEAYGIVESSKPKNKIKKMYKLTPLSLYRVEIEIEYTTDIKTSLGLKYSDNSANKGVAVEVRKEEDMPIDSMGNRVDLIMDIMSTPSRLNVGRLYEQYIKGSLLTVNRLIRAKIKELGFIDPRNLSNNHVKDIFSILVEFTDILDNVLSIAYHNAYRNNDYDDMRDVIVKAFDNGFMIYLEAGNEKEFYKIIEEIKVSRFRPHIGKLTHNLTGKEVTTEYDIMVAPMYILSLSKIADDLLCTASASVNHYGLPVVVSKSEKYSMPHKNSPLRLLGESELRVMASYGGIKLTAELKDINASLKSHALVYGNILKSIDPVNMEKAIDRRSHPYGTDRALTIFNTLCNTAGFEIAYVKDNERFVDTSHADDIIDNTVINLDVSEEIVDLDE